VKVKNILKLNTKKLTLLVVAEIFVIIFHNLFSALLGIEEVIFFIISALVIPAYLLIAITYSFWIKLSKIKDSKKAARLAGLFIISAYGVLVSETTQSSLVVMFFDVISGLSVIGIAILLFPFFRKTNKQLSKTYLSLKWTEGLLMIFGGIIFLFGCEDGRDILYEGLHLWVFILGGFVLYYLFLKSKLIPKFISMWGLLAIFSLLIKTALEFLNIYNPLLDALLILIITNEVSLAIWLITKGLKTKNNK
jgi:hypothetical protein